MLDPAELKRAIALHEKAFGLLLWLNRSFRSGRRTLQSVRGALTLADAARDWLRRNHAQIPEEFRPGPAEIEALSLQFTSFLSTSFEVVRTARLRCAGCFCCGWWDPTTHLRARNPGKKAARDARELKRVALRELAREVQAWLPPEREERFLDLSALTRVTYARELVRRSRFASQGEGVLALWREMPEGDRLSLKSMLAAEREVLEALTG